MFACVLFFGSFTAALAQDLQPILQTHSDEIAKPSRSSVGLVLEDLAGSGSQQVTVFLEQWAEKNIWQGADGLFVIGTSKGDVLSWEDIDSGVSYQGEKNEFKQMKPNGGVRRLIGTALVQFQLSDPDLGRRSAAVASIARRPGASQLEPLIASIDVETDDYLRARKIQLAIFLSARFAKDAVARIGAIESLATDTSVAARAVLNQILSKSSGVALVEPTGNIATILDPFVDAEAAYAELVEAEFVPRIQTSKDIRQALEANIVVGRIGSIPIAQLSDPDLRIEAYSALAHSGLVPELVTLAKRDEALMRHTFFELYSEPNAEITDAAKIALSSVETRVGAAQMIDYANETLEFQGLAANN